MKQALQQVWCLLSFICRTVVNRKNRSRSQLYVNKRTKLEKSTSFTLKHKTKINMIHLLFVFVVFWFPSARREKMFFTFWRFYSKLAAKKSIFSQESNFDRLWCASLLSESLLEKTRRTFYLNNNSIKTISNVLNNTI